MGRTTAAEHAPAARVVLVALAVAVAVALLVAQHLKDKPPLINGSSDIWHPAGTAFDPSLASATFSFVPDYGDRLTVSIVDERTGAVAKVFPAFTFNPHRYRTPTLRWNGRSTDGRLAPPGRYEVRVHFASLDRTTTDPTIEFTIK